MAAEDDDADDGGVGGAVLSESVDIAVTNGGDDVEW